MMDWNRALFMSADPVILTVAFLLLEAHPDVDIVKVKNKLADEEALKSGLAVNVHVNIRVHLDRLDGEGRTSQIMEVQFVPEDFYVVQSVRHKWYEVSRRKQGEDIVEQPIFED